MTQKELTSSIDVLLLFNRLCLCIKCFDFITQTLKTRNRKVILNYSWDHKGGEIQKQEIRNFQYTIYVQFFSTILRKETLNSWMSSDYSHISFEGFTENPQNIFGINK